MTLLAINTSWKAQTVLNNALNEAGAFSKGETLIGRIK
jgi:hypothetical protein